MSKFAFVEKIDKTSSTESKNTIMSIKSKKLILSIKSKKHSLCLYAFSPAWTTEQGRGWRIVQIKIERFNAPMVGIRYN